MGEGLDPAEIAHLRTLPGRHGWSPRPEGSAFFGRDEAERRALLAALAATQRGDVWTIANRYSLTPVATINQKIN